MEIRQMTLQDLEELKPSLLSNYDNFWNYNIFKEELQNQNSKYFIATENSQILGFAGIWNAVYDMHITNIVVRKDLRKCGIGSKLLEKLIEVSKAHKAETLTLEVNCRNIPAIKLYEKFGFSIAGKRQKYYNNVDDALIMTIYFK